MLQWSQNREAKQKRAVLITVASRAAKNGLLEKDQERRKLQCRGRKASSRVSLVQEQPVT
jgi:hypothetical protein